MNPRTIAIASIFGKSSAIAFASALMMIAIGQAWCGLLCCLQSERE